jgi:hypothetical protein
MSETLVGFLCVVVWLALAGWAFRRLGGDTPRNIVVPMFFATLLLSPFAAGVALAELKRESKTAMKELETQANTDT